MKELNPADYDYLGSDYEVNFLFVSCYLFKEFRKSDIVLLYDWEKKELKFFLSKEDRRRYSKYAIDFYGQEFSHWQARIADLIQKGRQIIEETLADQRQIKQYSNSELTQKILKRARLSRI